MKYILPVLALLALPLMAESANAKGDKSFRNNTGRAAYMLVRSMPDDMRDAFREKMQEHRKQWHEDMSQIHDDMKQMTKKLKSELGKSKISQKKVDDALKPLQNKLGKNGARAMETMGKILTDVIVNASPEDRAEMAEELEEVLDEWEEYKVRPSRWWQFWR